ncbi:hypothetical protein [Bradyrhizobium macuxiense]|uniref:hypothetical protein n=1 Tax=Bradyrhizobium macuxiense TaxID=1755647 RepID=UPI001365AFA8|nr:hypothetical protein [Bradyrhizobium macuxiense]
MSRRTSFKRGCFSIVSLLADGLSAWMRMNRSGRIDRMGTVDLSGMQVLLA